MADHIHDERGVKHPETPPDATVTLTVRANSEDLIKIVIRSLQDVEITVDPRMRF